MHALLLMRVVEQERAAQLIAVVEDDRAARVLELGHRWMRHRTAVDAPRLSDQRAYRVEIMNRVIQNLESRRPFEKLPQVPRLLHHEAHFDVDDVAKLS